MNSEVMLPFGLLALPTFDEHPGDDGGRVPAVDQAEVVALVGAADGPELQGVLAGSETDPEEQIKELFSSGLTNSEEGNKDFFFQTVEIACFAKFWNTFFAGNCLVCRNIYIYF